MSTSKLVLEHLKKLRYFFQKPQAGYQRIFDLKIATPQIVTNYCEFLEKKAIKPKYGKIHKIFINICEKYIIPKKICGKIFFEFLLKNAHTIANCPYFC